MEKDGYEALQLGFEDKKEKHTTKPEQGHFKKAGVAPKRHLAEFKGFDESYKLGDEITVAMFDGVEFVDVIGTSKGKGFQGVVKRHGFGGEDRPLTVSTTVSVLRVQSVHVLTQPRCSRECAWQVRQATSV